MVKWVQKAKSKIRKMKERKSNIFWVGKANLSHPGLHCIWGLSSQSVVLLEL